MVFNQVPTTNQLTSLGSGTGLKAEYFDNADLTNLKLTRTDATVNFNWGRGAPASSISSDTFSARWTGKVQPLYSETYTFHTQSDDGVRLWINGSQIINQWNNHAAREDRGSIQLQAGQQYDIKVEYYENAGDATSKLMWSSLSQTKQIIPQSQLYTSALTTTPPSGNSATTYYVAGSGSDNNPGTQNQPFKTIQQAVNQIVNGAGGTIFVRGGTYTLNSEVTIGTDHDGSANSHLVLRPYGNEKVVLAGTKNSSGISVGGDYVDITGFEVSGFSQGIVGWKAHHLQVLNNTVHDTDANGIAIYGDKLGGTSDIVVDGNTVYHTNLNNQARDPNRGGWGNAIFISRGKNAVVTNNRVYENYGEGIISSLSDQVRAAYNTVYDNYSVEMYMDNATNTVFENNLIYTTGNSGFFRSLNNQFGWQAAASIAMANESYSDSNPNNNNIVRNNVVVGGRYGLSINNDIKNTQIVNNTFYGATERLVLFWNATQNQNVTIANNIFNQTNGIPMTYAPGQLSGVNFNHNLWYGGGAGTFAGSGDVNANPQFVGSGGWTALNYKLQSSSPAIDRGVASNITIDYFGESRPQGQGYDIGADEF